MGTPWPFVAFAATLGLAVGSFLNVVIYRVPRHESIVSPGSHCPTCDVAIRAQHNVPLLGWLVLRGRCASCRTRISARYPLVEAVTAGLFAAATLRFGLTLQLPAFLYLIAVGVALAMIDLDAQRLPDSIVLPSYVVSAVLLLPAGAAAGDWHSGVRALAGMAAFVALSVALATVCPDSVHLGDAKLAGVLGLYLGWLSWDAVFVAAVGSFVLAGVGGALALVGGRGARAPATPMVPYLIGASALALFVTAPAVGWYGSLLTA